MNILFLTLLRFESIQERNIYTDLLREFIKHGHRIYAISPVEKRYGLDTKVITEENSTILQLKIGNTQKTNLVEKGISTVMIEPALKKAVKKYYSNIKFDLVLYSTPPITFVSAIEYVKRRDQAKTYLLLKDIFPQNALDMGMVQKSGLKGIIYRHFRKKEKRLYRVSDRIGCMSEANVEYVLHHNPEVSMDLVEVCPNSIEVIDKSVDSALRDIIRNKYDIPLSKTVFVYGGNLGKPQGIPFIIECLEKCQEIEDAFFLIVGDGTEYGLLEEYVNQKKQMNLKLMKRLPKEDYDTLVGACDIGLIFLDHRFTIPNFPSRLLAYMQAKIPVFACTDANTDIGNVIIDGEFGWWCESNDSDEFVKQIQTILRTDIKKMGNRAFGYLAENYSAERSYQIIMND